MKKRFKKFDCDKKTHKKIINKFRNMTISERIERLKRIKDELFKELEQWKSKIK